MFIASVCPSVCPSVRLSVCPSVRLKPKFGRLKPKFDDDAEGGPLHRPLPEKLSSAPRSTSSICIKLFRYTLPLHYFHIDPTVMFVDQCHVSRTY